MIKTSDLIWQDTQHQKLFKIIDSLKDSPENTTQNLEKLSDYTVYHFELEEKYMKLTHYPRAEAHIQAHIRFEEKIFSLNRSKNISRLGFKVDGFRGTITQFLSRWLTGHVMGIDKDLEDFILKSRYK